MFFFCRIHDQIEDGAHKNKLKNAWKRRWNDEYFVIIRRNPVCIAMMSDLILFPGPNVDRMSDRFSDPAFCQQNKLMNYFFKKQRNNGLDRVVESLVTLFLKRCPFLLMSGATCISRLAPGFDIFIFLLIESTAKLVQANSNRPVSKENMGFVICLGSTWEVILSEIVGTLKYNIIVTDVLRTLTAAFHR